MRTLTESRATLPASGEAQAPEEPGTAAHRDAIGSRTVLTHFPHAKSIQVRTGKTRPTTLRQAFLRRNLQLGKRLPQPAERTLDHRAALPLAFHAQHAVVAVVAEHRQHAADVLGVDPVADRALADRDARLVAADGRGQRLADVLHVDVSDRSRNRRQNATGSWPAMKLLPVSRLSRK